MTTSGHYRNRGSTEETPCVLALQRFPHAAHAWSVAAADGFLRRHHLDGPVDVFAAWVVEGLALGGYRYHASWDFGCGLAVFAAQRSACQQAHVRPSQVIAEHEQQQPGKSVNPKPSAHNSLPMT